MKKRKTPVTRDNQGRVINNIKANRHVHNYKKGRKLRSWTWRGGYPYGSKEVKYDTHEMKCQCGDTKSQDFRA